LKVVHICTSDLSGGAAIACKRIVDAQALNGIDSKLLVQKKVSSDIKVSSTTTDILSTLQYNLRMLSDEGFIRFFTYKEKGRFSNPVIGMNVNNHPIIIDADIINLQWINGGFLSLDALRKIGRLGKPIVWTMHDMWAFTGGCHYVSDCKNYLTECRNCPVLKFRSNIDTSNRIFNQKRELYNKLNLTIVTTSKWLASEVSNGALLKDKKVCVIPTPIDSDLFKPYDKKTSRKKLNLPVDKKLILIGAMNLKDDRKGFKYLIEALQIINKLNELKDLELAVFGKLDESVLSSIPLKVNQLGRLKTETEIVLTYNSADAFVAPSLEDNLPNTIMESMACGTPVVAFNAGGIPDLIDDGRNGILARLKSVDNLAAGVVKLLTDEALRIKMSEASREKVLAVFNQAAVAREYKQLYTSLIQNNA
jgi:glycosyltransferase involved in cell wall biosynthesis